MAGRAPGRAPVRRPPGCATTARDRGSVTVEAALALCGLAVFLALAVGAVVAVTAAVRCTDAARELARLAARGEPDRGREVAAALAPAGAHLVLTGGALADEPLVAEVSTEPLAPLPVRVRGRAVAAPEPGTVLP
jgi:Flp pilus assembly protein TadG